MKRLICSLLLIFATVLPATAQHERSARPRGVTSLPGLPCSERDYVQLTGSPYTTSLCKNGAWVPVPTSATELNAPMSCTDAVGTDSYACNLSPAITGYTTNAHYRFKAGTANTGAASLALNNLAAITIKKASGGVTTDLSTNDIRSGQMVDVVYDGSNFQMQSTLGNASELTNSAGANVIPKSDGTNFVASGLADNGTTVSTTENISTSGSIATGAGGSVAGTLELTQGTAPTLGTTSVKFYAPTSVTSYGFVFPSTSATGFLLGTNAANVNTLSFVSSTGSGNVALAGSPTFTGTVGAAGLTQTGQYINSLNGAVSAPAMTLTGTAYGAGSATTNKPLFLIEPTGATSTGWGTVGTLLGVNNISGTLTINLADFQYGGVSRLKVDGNGIVTGTSWDVNAGLMNALNYNVGSGWMRINSGASGGIGLGSGHNIAFASGTTNSGNTGDTGISRVSGGLLGIGTGAQGSTAGSLSFTAFTASGATQTFSNAAFTTCTALTTSSNVLACTVSDARVKRNFSNFTRGLAAIAKLRPQTYQFRPGTPYFGKGQYHTSLIAQNVETAIPEAVSDIGNGTKQIDNAVLISTMVNAINELRVTVQRQQREINLLKKRKRQ